MEIRIENRIYSDREIEMANENGIESKNENKE